MVGQAVDTGHCGLETSLGIEGIGLCIHGLVPESYRSAMVAADEYANPPRVDRTISENTPSIKELVCEIRYYSIVVLRDS